MAQGPLERIKKGIAPRGLRLAVAEGIVPLDGPELVEAYSILAFDPDDEVRSSVESNLSSIPRQLLLQASRDAKTDESFIHFLARVFNTDDELLSGIILNKGTSNDTLIALAQNAPPSILTLLSENRLRMTNCPAILDALMANDELPKVNRYALMEFKESLEKRQEDIDVSSDKEFTQKTESEVDRSIGSTTESETPDSTLSDTQELELPTNEELDRMISEPDDESEEAFQTKGELSHEEEVKNLESGLSTASKMDIADLQKGWDLDDLMESQSDKDDEMEAAADEDDFGFEDIMEIKSEDQNVENDDWVDVEFDSELSGLDEEDEELLEELAEEEKIEDTRIRLMKMAASEKMLMAKMGTKQERAILVRDSNKKVAVAVIQSPKMTEFEIKMIAANRSVCEEVLREIQLHREWGKSPSIRKELVLNPKTPLAVSLRLLNQLNDFDLKEVAKSKEIPYGLSANAKRLFDLREQRRQKRKG